MAARHLRHQVGGRRRDDDQVRLAREPDVADVVLVVAVEQVGEDLAAGQRADRERRDEFLRRRWSSPPARDARARASRRIRSSAL